MPCLDGPAVPEHGSGIRICEVTAAARLKRGVRTRSSRSGCSKRQTGRKRSASGAVQSKPPVWIVSGWTCATGRDSDGLCSCCSPCPPCTTVLAWTDRAWSLTSGVERHCLVVHLGGDADLVQGIAELARDGSPVR
jgi:hypothetical protein